MTRESNEDYPVSGRNSSGSWKPGNGATVQAKKPSKSESKENPTGWWFVTCVCGNGRISVPNKGMESLVKTGVVKCGSC